MSAEEQAHRAIDLIAATPPPQNAQEELRAFYHIALSQITQLSEAQGKLRHQINISKVQGFMAAVQKAEEDWL
jgi:hypothetical protein